MTRIKHTIIASFVDIPMSASDISCPKCKSTNIISEVVGVTNEFWLVLDCMCECGEFFQYEVDDWGNEPPKLIVKKEDSGDEPVPEGTVLESPCE